MDRPLHRVIKQEHEASGGLKSNQDHALLLPLEAVQVGFVLVISIIHYTSCDLLNQPVTLTAYGAYGDGRTHF